MNIIGIAISTWISLVALAVAIITFVFNYRKHTSEKRAILAKYIADMKTEYAEGLIIIDKIIAQDNLIKQFISEDKRLSSMIQIEDPKFSEAKDAWKSFYDKLGYIDPNTDDPMVLSRIIVETRHMKEILKQILNDREKIIDKLKQRRNK